MQIAGSSSTVDTNSVPDKPLLWPRGQLPTTIRPLLILNNKSKTCRLPVPVWKARMRSVVVVVIVVDLRLKPVPTVKQNVGRDGRRRCGQVGRRSGAQNARKIAKRQQLLKPLIDVSGVSSRRILSQTQHRKTLKLPPPPPPPLLLLLLLQLHFYYYCPRVVLAFSFWGPLGESYTQMYPSCLLFRECCCSLVNMK